MNDIFILKTKGGKGFVLIDPTDAPRCVLYPWSTNNSGYATSSRGLLHRFILTVNETRIQIDHKNTHRIDNRKSNLRKVGRGRNNQFRGKIKTKTSSRFKGVSRSGKYWVADITKKYKQYRLGYFKTEEEAALVYNNKAKELYGEHACINIL